MQSNIAKRIYEEAVDIEVQLVQVHSKHGELLFEILKDKDGNDKNDVLFNILSAFDHLLATLEKAWQ